MRKVVFDEGKAKRLRGAGMSYGNIAKQIEGATKITIWRFLSPGKLEEHRESQKKRQRKTKARLIEYKGGECSICGYDKCQTSLSFHHLLEEEKSFGTTYKVEMWDEYGCKRTIYERTKELVTERVYDFWEETEERIKEVMDDNYESYQWGMFYTRINKEYCVVLRGQEEISFGEILSTM